MALRGPMHAVTTVLTTPDWELSIGNWPDYVGMGLMRALLYCT